MAGSTYYIEEDKEIYKREIDLAFKVMALPPCSPPQPFTVGHVFFEGKSDPNPLVQLMPMGIDGIEGASKEVRLLMSTFEKERKEPENVLRRVKKIADKLMKEENDSYDHAIAQALYDALDGKP